MVVSVLDPSGAETLRQNREILSVNITNLINEYGPKAFPDFDGKIFIGMQLAKALILIHLFLSITLQLTTLARWELHPHLLQAVALVPLASILPTSKFQLYSIKTRCWTLCTTNICSTGATIESTRTRTPDFWALATILQEAVLLHPHY